MAEHPIQGLMTTAMENLKGMTEVNTIIGEPIESPDGSFIVPVSKVGFGFAAGGSEFSSGQDDSDSLPFGGGSGGGVSITPIAFLILGKNGIKMVHMDQQTHLYEKMLNQAPQVVEKLQSVLKEGKGSMNGNKENRPEKKEKGKEEDSQKEERSKSDSYDI